MCVETHVQTVLSICKTNNSKKLEGRYQSTNLQKGDTLDYGHCRHVKKEQPRRLREEDIEKHIVDLLRKDSGMLKIIMK